MYNVYCKQEGCTQYHRKDDIDDGWPVLQVSQCASCIFPYDYRQRLPFNIAHGSRTQCVLSPLSYHGCRLYEFH